MLPEINQLISQRLHSLAQSHQATIIYACESGSRAWGFPSPDSDYDVRFIYAHPWDRYLRLAESRDVIDLPITATALGVLDIGGWDLRKTLRLLGKSNPVIWEWLQSPILYQTNQTANLPSRRELFDTYYSPIQACHHYLSICRQTMASELHGSHIKIKKYFYMLRPLLAAIWLEDGQAIPPMQLQDLLAVLASQTELLDCIESLLQQKQHTDEQVPIRRVEVLDRFLLKEFARLQQTAQRLPSAKGDMRALDQLFLELLGLKPA